MISDNDRGKKKVFKKTNKQKTHRMLYSELPSYKQLYSVAGMYSGEKTNTKPHHHHHPLYIFSSTQLQVFPSPCCVPELLHSSLETRVTDSRLDGSPRSGGSYSNMPERRKVFLLSIPVTRRHWYDLPNARALRHQAGRV